MSTQAHTIGVDRLEGFSTAPTFARWHRRTLLGADLAGGLVLLTPILLSAFMATRSEVVLVGMYGLALLALLPQIGPFLGSLRRSPANLALLCLFAALAVSTVTALVRQPWEVIALQAKALGATGVWASIYVVVFSSVKTPESLARLMRWIGATCAAITASVYLSVLLRQVGISFGEILEFRDGGIRAFGPLGDQVGFILALAALTSLAASRPLAFGVHLGALFLTATRGAVMCLGIGVLLYLAALATGRVRQKKNRVTWLAVAAMVGGALWLSPLSSVFLGRAWESPFTSEYSFRPRAMQLGLEVFLDYPALGVGFDGFHAARPAVYEDWTKPDQAFAGISRTQNQYIQTATDGGVPAVLALLLFVWLTARNAMRVAAWRGATPALMASQLWLVSVLVGNQGALWLLSNAATGFFVFALAGVAARASIIARDGAQPRVMGPFASATNPGGISGA